jgi:hypothetical protein
MFDHPKLKDFAPGSNEAKAYTLQKWEIYVDIFCGFLCFTDCYQRLLQDFGTWAMQLGKKAVRALATEYAKPK